MRGAQKKRGGEKAISRAHLKEYIDKIDYVLITMAECRMDAVQDLVLNYGVPLEKIWFFRYTGDKDDYTFIEVFKREYSFFGQFYDDVLLWHLFQKLGYSLSNIHYLEIGTNDPVLCNNSFFFYTHGARGCLVDPLPLSEYFCSKMRSGDKFVRAAISSASGGDTTFFISAGTQVSSLRREHAGKGHWEIKVPQIGINDLLASLDFIPDLLLIDAEGEDEIILQALDYNKYHPIIIEAEMDKMEREGEKFRLFMKVQGYTLFTQLGGNFIFIDTEKWNNIRES